MTPQELATKTGEVIGVSDWLEVSQDRINKFAEATGDFQFIHVDPDKAKLTPFGGTIAHGFLTLSLIPALGAMTEGARVDGIKMGVNYGGNKTRFISPVRFFASTRRAWLDRVGRVAVRTLGGTRIWAMIATARWRASSRLRA